MFALLYKRTKKSNIYENFVDIFLKIVLKSEKEEKIEG